MKPNNRAVLQRPLTRAFAKRNGWSVQDLTLDDLDAASGKNRTRKSAAVVSSRHPQEAIRSPKEGVKIIPIPNQLENLESDSSERAEPKPRTSHARRGAGQSHVELRLGQTRAHRVHTEINQSARPPVSDFRDSGHFSTVSTWLNDLDAPAPNASQVVLPSTESSYDVRLSDAQDMESSSSLNTSNSAVNDDATTTKASTAKHISFMEHLEFRGITEDSSEDRNLQDLNLDKITQATPREIAFQTFDNLLKTLELTTRSLKRFIKDKPSENGFPFYDKLRRDIMEWRPQSEDFRRFPPTLLYYFDWDRRDCFNSSEATFHRTIMMSIIDRYDFHGLFSYSCEEQWKISSNFLIQPTRINSRITQPKPDLAISFHRDALKDSDLLDYPLELGKCLHPGSKGRERWFPFFFMEAKRDDCSLRDAFEKNLHSASQALLNIYQWVQLVPEMTEKFFTEVRVFSVTLNNEDLTLRMHRAEKDSTGRLRFKYVVVVKISDYDQFDTSHIIKSVLIDYAKPRLLPILKGVFKAAIRSAPSSAGRTKRKHDAMQTVPSLSEEPQTTSTGLSFDAERMGLTESSRIAKQSRQGVGRRRGANRSTTEE